MEVDRISSLPDGIICHILSLLPVTECAVATSVLSKRWYPLWRYVPVLIFNDEHVHDDTAYLRFKEFILSVLLFRDPTQPIKSLTIELNYHCDDNNINKWVSFVLQRGGVEYLDLITMLVPHDLSLFHKLPIAIFKCRTLVVLKLVQFRVQVNDVSSVELPLLKVLHLENIQCTEYRLLPQFLSGCPNLEDFTAISIRNDSIISDVHFKILTKLMGATMFDCYFKFPLKALYNVEYLNLNIREMSHHYDHMPVFYNLTKVKLLIYNYWRQWLLELLKHCPKLQILTIIKDDVMDGHDENWVCPRFVPDCIALHLRECTIYQYGGMDGELRFARYILQNAGVLKTMAIHTSTLSSNYQKKLQILQDLSLCLRSSATCKLIFK